jgi:hypothetical protein
MHVRFNELRQPERIPMDGFFQHHRSRCIVVPHTRLDSRQAQNAFFQQSRLPDNPNLYGQLSA